jgi:large subunit ribosomal protein L16
MMQPKKTKWRKRRKGRLSGLENRAVAISFGSYALKATDFCHLKSNQIEAARKIIARATNRQGQLWIRVFPDWPVTRKPNEVRMGSGKGSVDHWCFRVRPGRIIFELDGVSLEVAQRAFALASEKLPFECKMISFSD